MTSKKKTMTLGNISKKDKELFRNTVNKTFKTPTQTRSTAEQHFFNTKQSPGIKQSPSIKQSPAPKQPSGTQKTNMTSPSRETSKGDNDFNMFRKHMKGVKPLDNININQSTSSKRHDPNKEYLREKAAKFHTNPGDELSDYIKEPVNSEQKLAFYRPGLQIKIFDKLKSGQMPIDAVIDLHGKTVDEARNNLARFLKHCFINNRCCIKIIHGKNVSDKGKYPLIKTLINEWLPQVDYVMAFCSAQARDGGTGASYVLLKRSHR